MDETWEQWLSDLEVDDSNVMDHHRYKYSYDFIATTPEVENATLQKDSCCFQPCLSSESDSCRSSDPSLNTVNPLKMKDTVTSVSNSPIDDTSFESERPAKQLKSCVNITASLSPPIPADSVKNKTLASQKSASPLKSYILSFDKPSSTPVEATEHFQSSQACDLEGRSKGGTPPVARNSQYSHLISGFCVDEPNRGSNNKEKRGRSTPKTSYHSKDHIMAERKRRENLSLRFIALSATIPGLKKTDKASVLGDAIRYVKQLKDRVKELEEDANKSRVESVVYVKKSVVSAGEDDSLGDDNSEDGTNYVALPEVEARVAGKNMLVRIHCLKQKGLLEKLLREIENLHLVVLNSCALPFGNSIHDITIVAQMDVEYNITVKELVKHLRLAVAKFTCV